MVASLEEIDSIFADDVDDSVFLGQPSRPRARQDMFEGFGLADSRERIRKDGFHQL